MAASENPAKFDITGFGDFDLRELREDDLPQLNELVSSVGWSIMPADIKCHFKMQPRAFLGLFDGDGGLMAHILVANIAKGIKNISFFITRDDLRGKGIGGQLFRHVLQGYRSHNVILSAVPAAQGFYTKCGFQASNLLINCFRLHHPKPLTNAERPSTLRTVPISIDNLQLVADYDKCIGGLDRLQYLSEWLLLKHARSYAAFDVADVCVGFISLRVAEKYSKSQPLYADSAEIAFQLLQCFLSDNPDVTPLMRIDVLDCEGKADFVEGLHRFGTVELMDYTECLMYSNGVIEHQNAKVFSVTNSETAII